MAKDEQKVASNSSKKASKPARSKSKSKAPRRVPFADATAIGRNLTEVEAQKFLGLLGSHGLNQHGFCRKLVDVCREPLTQEKLDNAKRQIQYVLSRQRKWNAPLAAECAKTLGITINEFDETLRKSLPAAVSPPAEEKTPHNLPEAPVRFFGHEQLRRDVAGKLAVKGLIVLHETGGIGKTTFAKQTAHDAFGSGRLPGGAVWIDCEPNPTFEHSIRTMAEVLMGIRMEDCSAIECENRLEHYFARHHTLIVFDNFETVLWKGDFNKFVKEHASRCRILITTREIHDGMIPHVQSFHELAAPDAAQLFAYEAGFAPSSAEEVELVASLCEAVGNFPLAVVLLARQSPKTTLSQLASELQRNSALLATDDAFLNPRHRSMTACFLISFERLSAEDHDTLFRLSVVPYGLGKQLAAAYLDKTTWLSSLTNCLHSALLRLEGERYVLHPLVKSFLQDQMGIHKDEWECRFVDFFCGWLNDAKPTASDQTQRILREEAYNFSTALSAAATAVRYEHLIPIIQWEPDAWHEPDPNCRFWFDFATDEKPVEAVVQFLQSALESSRRAFDTAMQEKLMVLQYEYFFYQCRSVERRENALKELGQLNPSRADALRWNAIAHDHIVDSEGEKAAFERAEVALMKAAELWEEMKGKFPGEFEASLRNLFAVRACLGDGRKAGETSRVLWKIAARSSRCDTVSTMFPFCMDPHYFDWAVDATRRLQFFTSSAEQKEQEFFRLAETVGGGLFCLKQWAESEPWLKETLAWKQADHSHDGPPEWQEATIRLAKAWTRLGRPSEAETAFHSILSSTRQPDDIYWNSLNLLKAEAHLEIAKIEAQRGEFSEAAARAVVVAEDWRKHLSCYIVPNRKTEIVEMDNLIAEWKRKAKRRQKPESAK